jgi:hypothetical protein
MRVTQSGEKPRMRHNSVSPRETTEAVLAREERAPCPPLARALLQLALEPLDTVYDLNEPRAERRREVLDPRRHLGEGRLLQNPEARELSESFVEHFR